MSGMIRRCGTPKQRRIPSGREIGFTLVELLIVILVGTAVMGAVVGLLFMFITNFEINKEYTAARQRGEMVFSILAGPVLAAGLGMPESADFQALFSVGSGNGPIFETVDESGDQSGDLFVAYALPSGLGILGEQEFSQSTPMNVDLTGTPDLPGTMSLDLIDSWITFPSSGRAFYVSNNDDLSDNTLELTPGFTGTIPFFDELHYVKAMRATVKNGVFRAEELINWSEIDPDETENTLGEVDGILDMVFRFDPGTRVLTAWVLARGDQREPDLVTPATLPDWPGNSLTEEMQHYRVSIMRTSWRVRN